jgi:hypothetical protein
MQRTTLLLTLLAVPCLTADDGEPRLHFKANGYSIAPLDEASDKETCQALMMFLPPSGGFAPNVNVVIEPHKGTIKEYVDLSREGFGAVGFTVTSETVGESSVTFEYVGTMQGHRLQWYATATLGRGKVYLVTATATPAQWKTVGARLKACVNSFKQEPPAPEAAPR